MSIVALDRRFIEWDEKEPPDPEFHRGLGLGEVGIGWDELLDKRRVVILAEAGSGKSTEIAERARQLAATNKPAFHAAVEDVATDGLEASLGTSMREALAAWRMSTDKAWFFIDSVDEAKSKGVRLEKVLRKLADGIHGAEERAHIILTGRITDWEFRKDLQRLKEWLPVATRESTPSLTPEEELLILVGDDRSHFEEALPPELPTILLMAPLDRERVRRFTSAKALPHMDGFLEAVETADLWHFARRPMDLEWLIQFWRDEGRLGSLAEMIERSILERLKETSTTKSRSDTLDGATALQAVERIAASMVFGKQATIAIPDGELAFVAESALDLAEVLSDWSADNRLRLLTRAVFDPATLGRIRFHNDNEGVVRSYLTARWLLRLRRTNLPTRSLFDLLFAKSYGMDVIRPSMNETAAWLSLWDEDVANEVAWRCPLLLFVAGDPATLSSETRRHVLERVLKDLAAGNVELRFLQNEKLRRFAQADLGSAVAALWPIYRAYEDTAQLLLRIVWLGSLRECAALAYDAAFNWPSNSTTRVFAGRALLATCGANERRKYADFVVAEQATLPRGMVGDALWELFPTLIGVKALLEVLEASDLIEQQVEWRFESDGPRLIEKLLELSDLEELLRGLLRLAGSGLRVHRQYERGLQEEKYHPSIAAAALRLLQVSPPSTPEVAVEAILCLCNQGDLDAEEQSSLGLALKELHGTPLRRSFAFWRVAERLENVSSVDNHIDQLWKMRMAGYSPDLQVEDVDWLLREGLSRSEHDCRLAIDAVFEIYRSAGAPTWLLDKIASSVSSHPLARTVYLRLREAAEAPTQTSDFDTKIEGKRSQAAEAKARDTQLWLGFVRDLRTDPPRIEKLKRPFPSNHNPDLLRLWHLLRGTGSRSRYAIDSVVPLERIAGPVVAEAARAGFLAHWRNSVPLVRSRKDVQDADAVRWIDLMGLSGISIEAASVSDWAKTLSSEEATTAAAYATLEINGFPPWISELAAAHPAEIQAVLFAEISDEITRTEFNHYRTLYTTSHATDSIVALLAPKVIQQLERQPPLPPGALSPLLRIALQGASEEHRPRLAKLGIDAFLTATDEGIGIRYLAVAFALDPRSSVDALSSTAASLVGQQKATLVDRFLSATFGDETLDSVATTTKPPGEVLQELVRLDFETYNSETARRRKPGVVYSTDAIDVAYQARSAVFNRLAQTSGAATYQALLRFENDPSCPVPAKRIRALAEERAIQDSDIAPWPPSELFQFEKSYETMPRTAKDLQSALLSRVEDMQHDLLHGDFSQGKTLRRLELEVDVQNWVADRLRLKQGRSFSVEREPHVVGEKEPDVRLRAKATDASVAMEIKIAESWSLNQLDKALEDQLCSRYLRARDGRYGVLLLVHHGRGKVRWEDTSTGQLLSFHEVVARLGGRAAEIAAEHHDAPQPEIASLDVSSC
jgi:hypothetical protein